MAWLWFPRPSQLSGFSRAAEPPGHIHCLLLAESSRRHPPNPEKQNQKRTEQSGRAMNSLCQAGEMCSRRGQDIRRDERGREVKLKKRTSSDSSEHYLSLCPLEDQQTATLLTFEVGSRKSQAIGLFSSNSRLANTRSPDRRSRIAIALFFSDSRINKPTNTLLIVELASNRFALFSAIQDSHWSLLSRIQRVQHNSTSQQFQIRSLTSSSKSRRVQKPPVFTFSQHSKSDILI